VLQHSQLLPTSTSLIPLYHTTPDTMSTTSFFRRPTYRAPSPPTWACYEQIPYDEDELSDSDGLSDDSASEADEPTRTQARGDDVGPADHVQNMDIDEAGDADAKMREDGSVENVVKKDIKGKGRAVEPIDEETKAPKTPSPRQRRQRPAYNPRPILTIHKSQGFVWNQVCSTFLLCAHQGG
jgi:hypothetical protein